MRRLTLVALSAAVVAMLAGIAAADPKKSKSNASEAKSGIADRLPPGVVMKDGTSANNLDPRYNKELFERILKAYRQAELGGKSGPVQFLPYISSGYRTNSANHNGGYAIDLSSLQQFSATNRMSADQMKRIAEAIAGAKLRPTPIILDKQGKQKSVSPAYNLKPGEKWYDRYRMQVDFRVDANAKSGRDFSIILEHPGAKGKQHMHIQIPPEKRATWAAEIVGGNGKITRIGVYNSYSEAQQASLRWSKANPKDLRLTREIELGGEKPAQTARIQFDDNAKKTPPVILKKEASPPTIRPNRKSLPAKPRTRSPLAAANRSRPKSKSTPRPRSVPRLPVRNSPASKNRSTSRKPATRNRSSVPGSRNRTVGRGFAGQRSGSQSASHSPVARRSGSSSSRRPTSGNRPTARRSTVNRPSSNRRSTGNRSLSGRTVARQASTYRRPAVNRSSTDRRPTSPRPSSSSYRTPARTAIHRRPAVRSTYRAPVRTSTARRSYSQPSYRRPAIRQPVRTYRRR